MKNNNMFVPRRLLLIMKRDVVSGYRTALVTAGVLTALFLVTSFLAAYDGDTRFFHEGFITPVLFIGGYIFTSMLFREAHRRDQVHNWLMLPASRWEKYLEKLLLGAVGYPVVVILWYSLAVLLGKGLISLILGESLPLFHPFQGWLARALVHYLIGQSLFFLGALWFRKSNFLKTVLFVALIAFGYMMVISGLATVIHWDYIREASHGTRFFHSLDGQWMTAEMPRWIEGMVTGVKILYYGLMAPVCWVAAWFRMKEIEVTDGI